MASISWENLMVLIRGRHNFRFCGTDQRTDEFLAGEVSGDCVAMIGAFPYIVYKALPDAFDFFKQSRNGLHINVTLESTLGEYLKTPTTSNWDKVLKVLEQRIAPTEKDRAEISAVFSEDLEKALNKGIDTNHIKSETLNLVLVEAKTMSCQEYGGYTLGKTGSASLTEEEGSKLPRYKSPRYRPGMKDDEQAKLVEELIEFMITSARSLTET